MTRYGETFINNFSKGAKCIKEKLNEDVIELAIKSSRLLNIDFCGVDIIEYKRQFFVFYKFYKIFFFHNLILQILHLHMFYF